MFIPTDGGGGGTLACPAPSRPKYRLVRVLKREYAGEATGESTLKMHTFQKLLLFPWGGGGAISPDSRLPQPGGKRPFNSVSVNSRYSNLLTEQ